MLFYEAEISAIHRQYQNGRSCVLTHSVILLSIIGPINPAKLEVQLPYE